MSVSSSRSSRAMRATRSAPRRPASASVGTSSLGRRDAASRRHQCPQLQPSRIQPCGDLAQGLSRGGQRRGRGGALFDLVQQQVERREAIRQVLKEPEPARQRARDRGARRWRIRSTSRTNSATRRDRAGPCGGPGQDALLDQPQVVAQRLERVGIHQRRRRPQLAQRFAGDQAAADEVSAVHRGDVQRMQGRERRGVDPVVEVPAVLRQPAPPTRGCARGDRRDPTR